MIPQKHWVFALITLAALMLAGLVVLLALALGAGDPPQAGPLRWQADTPQTWELEAEPGDITRYVAPNPVSALPLTLEVTAASTGSRESAWGIWLDTDPIPLELLISRAGYALVSLDQQPDWRGFPHIRPLQFNRLYVHLADDRATLRINDEIIWHGQITLPPAVTWGLITWRQPTMEWQGIRLYAQAEIMRTTPTGF
jgi:hypothetical protein